jgi:hypothetical protein
METQTRLAILKGAGHEFAKSAAGELRDRHRDFEEMMARGDEREMFDWQTDAKRRILREVYSDPATYEKLASMWPRLAERVSEDIEDERAERMADPEAWDEAVAANLFKSDEEWLQAKAAFVRARMRQMEGTA